MQSDTVIGIVGAVVLVAVMVGVFAYEYNNAPEEVGTDPTSPEAQMNSFNETFAGLGYMDDIDGDGTANWQDDDLDGDGIDNQNDTEIMFMHDFQGSVAARTPPGNPVNNANAFHVGTGMVTGTVTVEWAVQPANLGELVVAISGPEPIACDNAANGSATCDLSSAAPGMYTVEVRQSATNPQAKSFTGSIHIEYVAPNAS